MTDTADQLYVRKVNTVIVLDALRHLQPISRAALSKHTGLNRSTISSIIQSLMDINFVRETELQLERIGRPGMLLTLNPNGGFAIGLEINVDYVSAILVDFSGQLRRKLFRSINRDLAQHEILMIAVRMVTSLTDLGRSFNIPFLGLGIGLPGVVDTRSGTLVFAPNLGWRNLEIGTIFFNQFNVTVLVENEANCAALGEYRYGAAKGIPNLIYLSAGIGMGGGILIDGQLFSGSQGFAGEIGHMVIEVDGNACACGRHGCWETYVSPRAVVSRVREQFSAGSPTSLLEITKGIMQYLTFTQIVSAARQGDALSIQALAEVAHYLGLGIANLINIFNPHMIVIGGALAQAGDLIIHQMEDKLPSTLIAGRSAKCKLLAAQLGVDACLHGSVALVFDAVMRDPTNWLN